MKRHYLHLVSEGISTACGKLVRQRGNSQCIARAITVNDLVTLEGGELCERFGERICAKIQGFPEKRMFFCLPYNVLQLDHVKVGKVA